MLSISFGRIRRYAPSLLSSSSSSTAGSTTSTATLERHPDVPLQVHARYSRIEILAAFGIGAKAKVAAWQTGVYEAKGAMPSCWPSLSTRAPAPSRQPPATAITRSVGPDPLGEPGGDSGGQRHGSALSKPRADGRSIMLFTRLRADDRAFWFLGPATYRGHVGEKPMAITWELAYATARRPVSVVRRRGCVTGSR